MKTTFEPVDVYIDDVLICEDLETCYLMNHSGKHGGNGMLLNPLGVINDGANEIVVITKRMKAGELVGFMDKAIKYGGI